MDPLNTLPSLGLHNLPLFALTVLVLNATPGVDLLLITSRTLQHGLRAGLLTGAGITLGCGVHALAATFGLAALMATSAAAFELVKWAGAAYLLWLGIAQLRQAWHASAGTSAGAAAAPVSGRAHLRTGFLTNVLNPKVAIFFLALLPQFIGAGSAHPQLAFLALGLWFMAQSALFLLAVVLLVLPLRGWQPGSTVKRALDASAGMLFLGLAARLAWTRQP